MKKILFNTVLFLLLLSGALQSAAQTEDRSIQFSGLILTPDSLEGISNVYIRVPGTMRATISDIKGYFTFVAEKGDTVLFKRLGLKTSQYIISDTLSANKYSMVKFMVEDTFYLDEAIVYPLPSRELFDYYFVKTDIPDDELEIARKNLDREKIKEQAEAMGADGAELGKLHLRNESQKYYYAGQIQPMNIFSPIAWAQFIQAWKNGDFKKQKKE